MDDWLQGLIGAGIFFLGFFIGVLTMKLARRKEFKIREKDKPKVEGVIDTGVSLTGVPDSKEEEKMVDDITRNDLASELKEKGIEIEKEVDVK